MAINLEKRVEKVGIILTKRNILKAPIVRVGVILDVSESIHGMFLNGIIQETVARLLALGITFDDNGQMDMWVFDDNVQRLPQSSRDNYETYVQDEILDPDKNVSLWGSTSYAPVMDDAVDFYFRGTEQDPSNVTKEDSGFVARFTRLLGGGKKSAATLNGRIPANDVNIPALVLFVTDGRADDSMRAAKILRDAQQYPIYWSMVGVGAPRHFEFLKNMADELPNVGFVNMSSLNVDDDTLYDALITEEFCAWVAKH